MLRSRPTLSAKALFAALALALLPAVPAVQAGDAHLHEQTVLVVSTDNFGAMRSAMMSSDQGKFMQDPEIRRIIDTVKNGVFTMMKNGIADAAANAPEGNDADEVTKIANAAMDLFKEYSSELFQNLSGRVALSIGMFQDPSVPIPVNFVVEFGGNDKIHSLNGRLLDMIESGAKEEGVARSTFDLEGYTFQSLQKDGVGIMIGRKGDRFLAGIHRAGLTDYITAAKENKVRLGANAFYKKAMAEVGNGQLKTFFNMQPVMGLAMGAMAGMPSAPGEPSPSEMMNLLGLTNVQGMAGAANMTAAGTSQSLFVGMSGRKGLLRLIPTENKSLAPPPFAPASVKSATAMRIEIGQLMPMIRDMIRAVNPDQLAEFEGNLGMMKEVLGFTVDELVGDLEGTFFHASPLTGGAFNPMGMIVGGGGLPEISFALKLNSSDRFKQLLAMISNPEMTQGMVSKQTVSGREVWAASLPMGPMPIQIAATIEKDWLIFGTNMEAIKKAFAQSDSGTSLAGNAGFAGLAGKVGGMSGMSLQYADQGKTISEMLDMFRPMVGMLPMFVPELAQQPDLLFLFDPTILPSSATIQKYFGDQVSSTRVVSGGLKMQTWAPSKTAPAKKPDGEKPVGL